MNYRATYWFPMFLLLWTACRPRTEAPEEIKVQTGTPVSAANIIIGPMAETIELNATSMFMLKTPVRSVANGYLEDVIIHQGDLVTKGEMIMRVKTKEAQALGNIINDMDTSFHFKGIINIPSPGTGYISELNVQSGDYVQDGEQVAVISDTKSFAFILELPYELTPLLKINKQVELILPDHERLNGVIQRPFPSVDAASQTQSYIIAVNSHKMIPENLIAKVLLVKKARTKVMAVPKDALLTDETQSHFWIMKLVDDSTAIKVDVQKGMETGDRVEILSPVFSDTDRILISGNYGLPDSAKVYIVHQQ